MTATAKNLIQKKSPDKQSLKEKKTAITENSLESKYSPALQFNPVSGELNQAQPEDILLLQKRYGNRAVTNVIQAKLKVGQIGDHYEQEADRMADRIMSPIPSPLTSISSRQMNTPIQRQSSGEEEEELMMKPLSANKGGFETDLEIEKRINGQKGGGNELPNGVRSFMEARFQRDFSGIHIHSDSEAASLNQNLHARAFTLGRDVFFNSGEYQPDSDSGKRLLAHELTHVIQQTGSAPAAIQRKEIWEEVGMDKISWDKLSPVEKRTKLRTNAQTGQVQNEYGLETAGSWAGGNIANLAFGTANLGTGIASTVEGDNSTTATSVASIAVTGAQMAATGIAFAGSAATMHRGRMMHARGTQAGRLLGNRMMRRSGWAMGQQILGLGSGAAGIGSSAKSIQGNNDASNISGGIGAIFGGLGAALGVTQGSISMNSARNRSNRAQAVATSSTDKDMQNIAQQAASSQGKTSKGIGIFGNLMGGISSVLGAVKGLGSFGGTTGQVLSGIGVGLGFLGTAAGSLGGLVGYRSKKAQEKKLEAFRQIPAQITQVEQAIAQVDAQLSTNAASLIDEKKKLTAIEDKIKEKDTAISAAKNEPDRKKLELEKNALLASKSSQGDVVKAVEKEKTDLEAQKTALLQKKHELELARDNAEHEKLAYDPDAAAQKLIDGISKEPPNTEMVNFAENVLGVKPAVEIVLRDPEAAKELFAQKINKNG